MGWSSYQVESTGWNWSYIQYEAGTKSRIMLTYYNDTESPVNIKDCFINMGAGTSGSFGGYWAATTSYQAYASFSDSSGTTHTSNTITINNAISSYSGVTKKTFTFSTASYVAPGATIYITVYFIISAMTVVIAYYRGNSSSYGGTVSSAGLVKIWNGSTWVNAIPYIYNGSTWVQAIPYVYNGSEWKIGTG